ncbi:hypothetical protein [Luteibacter aegosomatissinici]|uniref:hypothetical protein n=1 Tax=Luteibacter aegosomatissinici TaxID=2911539 RepID=UPI001FFBCF01|nr:hypothetical protein [Luteibacter aegosomatissinici]UPG96592.1 hypothetical protein L2Y97_10880 [Luteibacter aegosomatissinici]
MLTLGLVITSAVCGSAAIALYNKGRSAGPKKGIAQLAWMLMGIAFSLWFYGGIGGLVYSLENGIITGQSRGGGSATFHHAEHPILYWATVTALSGGLGGIGIFAVMAFWQAFKKA